MALPASDPQPRRSKPERRRGWAWAGGVTLALVAGAVAGLAGLWHATPDAAGVASAVRAVPSRIVSADGTLLGVIGGRTARPVPLEQVSPHLVAALLATEDRRFHSHVGFDPVRLVAAAWHTLGGDTQGGSTITQQLARNLFPERVGRERSLMRKLRELMVALKIELAYGKREILTMYLNQVPFLYNVNGVEMASRTYFDKPAADLQPAEAALLVAMLKGPGHYDPVRAPGRALARRNLVLNLMARHGALAHPVAQQAVRTPLALNLRRHDLEPLHAPHDVRHLRRQAQAWADARGFDLARDGLTIHTTLDLRVQRLAEAAARLDEVPSLAPGTGPVSLLERVRADGTLASIGVRRDPVLIERIVDANGKEVARFGAEPKESPPPPPPPADDFEMTGEPAARFASPAAEGMPAEAGAVPAPVPATAVS